MLIYLADWKIAVFSNLVSIGTPNTFFFSYFILLFWSTGTGSGRDKTYMAANYNKVNKGHFTKAFSNVLTFSPWNAIFSLCPASAVVIPLSRSQVFSKTYR